KATVLTPHTAQVRLLEQLLQGRADVYSFQGEESDIIVFSFVHCNVLGDFGFLEDERKLNGVWTRGKAGFGIGPKHSDVGTELTWKKGGCIS
ncbi:hypothetical protein DL96DRAFT_1455101, partial [Flagelloscypha sp. PMI_526]